MFDPVQNVLVKNKKSTAPDVGNSLFFFSFCRAYRIDVGNSLFRENELLRPWGSSSRGIRGCKMDSIEPTSNQQGPRSASAPSDNTLLSLSNCLMGEGGRRTLAPNKQMHVLQRHKSPITTRSGKSQGILTNTHESTSRRKAVMLNRSSACRKIPRHWAEYGNRSRFALTFFARMCGLLRTNFLGLSTCLLFEKNVLT